MDSMLTKAYLQECVSNKWPVYVFLINGVKLSGVITGYDDLNYLLTTSKDGSMEGLQDIQLVSRSTVSTLRRLLK